ncbi:MAG TPA: carbonic anhydrase [Pyrinomonadaceae bacterium]
MKRASAAIALALLAGVITITPLANRPARVLASPAAPVYARPSIAGEADALLLSCMDYRLIDDTAGYMKNERHLLNKYDYVILAGASLGVNNRTYRNWGRTFWQHLDTAIALHGIHEVIVMDHRNCGAYKLLLGRDFPPDPTEAQRREEARVHKHQLDRLARAIHRRHADLDVTTLLMNLDGSVEEIGMIKGKPKSRRQ